MTLMMIIVEMLTRGSLALSKVDGGDDGADDDDKDDDDDNSDADNRTMMIWQLSPWKDQYPRSPHYHPISAHNSITDDAE